MTLPNWKAIPVRTKRSRKRLHNVIATEFNLDSWTELPNHIKRSKKRLFNYYAEELHLEEFKELLKKDVRSTREYYVYLKENANPSSAPTLTITVKSGESNVSGASVTIGEDSKTSDSDGVVEFDLEYGDYTATVEASGFVTATETLAFRSNHKNFTVTLESEPTPTFDGYKAIVYDEESSETPMLITLIKATGEEENNRKEYTSYQGSFWLDDDAVVDGTTKNITYETSDSESPYGYMALENVTVSDVTITLLDSDGEPYSQGYLAIGDVSAESIWDYAQTDENGQATLNSVYGNWQIYYSADSQHLIDNYEDVTIDSATETFTVQLPTPTESNATVTVYGIQGADDVPIENATVTVTSDGGSQTVTVTGTTNSDGVAEFNLDDGQYLVNVIATGWTQTMQEGWDFSSEDPQMSNYKVYLHEDV